MKTKFLGKLLVCSLVMLLGVVDSVRADSPLTSTEFYTVYEDLPAFEDTVSMYEYIMNDSISVEKRLAVINRQSWSIDGMNRATELVNILGVNFKTNDYFTVLSNLSGKQLICLAYLKAMDNYFNVEEAMMIAVMAEAKEPRSYAVNLIAALIRAQYASGWGDCWGAVYLCLDNVRNSSFLNQDMRPEAAALIFEYTDIYKEYVNKPHE